MNVRQPATMKWRPRNTRAPKGDGMDDRHESTATPARSGDPRMIPGAREARGLTRFAPLPEAVPNGDNLLDRATTAERQREGGGSPKEGRRLGGR